MIKVLFIARQNLFSEPGGDTIQMVETAKNLTKLGVHTDIYSDKKKFIFTDYDLLHFFNIIDPEDILGHIYTSRLPYVVSSIYVDYREYDSLHRNDAIGWLSKALPYNSVEYLKTTVKFILKNEKVSTMRFFLKGHKNSIKYILENASIVLPNSENETKRLVRDFGVNFPFHIIPNCVDVNLFNPQLNVNRDCVISVGRIEGRKNQLNLIKAMNNTGIKTVIIGKPSPNQKKYYSECIEAAASNIEFVPHLKQEELLKYYNHAKVHVLPSWFETTGLSSLEAAAMGCNIVVGDRGDVRDYFSDYAYYCDPNNINSIRSSILNAWNSEVKNEFREYIFSKFTWDVAAKETLTAYLRALKND